MIPVFYYQMDTVKQVSVRLFYNIANRCFYIQIGDCLCPIRDKLIAAIQEREQIEIIHAADTKEMQEICNDSSVKVIK